MADFNRSSKTTKRKRLPEWVPDWQRVVDGRPFNFDGLNEQRRHSIQKPLPTPVFDDELEEHSIKDGATRGEAVFQRREELRKSGCEQSSCDGRTEWVHKEIRIRAEMKNFRRFDPVAAATNEENARNDF